MIRKATQADLPAILQLEHDSFDPPHWQSRDFLQCIEPVSGALTRILLVDEEAGVVRGMTVGSALIAFFPVEAEIQNLAVAGPHRGKGVGRALLLALLEWASALRATVIRLEVRTSNERAIRLYEELGFRAVGKRAAYYRNPVEDAISMEMLVSR